MVTKVEHDGDGKLYYIDNNNNTQWLLEVNISNGDSVRDGINQLLKTNIINGEYIICAAIWVNDHKVHKSQPSGIDEGFVICGRRHHNCYQTIRDLVGDEIKYFKSINMSDDDHRNHQGFMTSKNRYVNRKEGWKIAIENNQVVYGLKVSDIGDESILISENLY